MSKHLTGKRPLRIGLAGCGDWSHVHLRGLAEIREARVVALCDPIKANLQRCLREHFRGVKPAPRSFAEFRRMIRRTGLDAVIIVTPHAAHDSQVRDALDAGLHVLCEKPMVTEAEQARELVDRARRSGRQLVIAHQSPVTRELAYIRNVLRRGDLGELQLVDTFAHQDWMQINVRRWRQKPEVAGGGMLYDTGAHMLNAMMWLLESPPRRVFAMLDNCGRPVEIQAALSIEFENGCLASVACVGNAKAPFDTGLTLYGTKGTIRTGVFGEWLKHYDASGSLVRYPYVPYEEQSVQRNFVNAVLGKDEARCPAHYGILLAELMEAVYESAEAGMPVTVRHREKPAESRRESSRRKAAARNRVRGAKKRRPS